MNLSNGVSIVFVGVIPGHKNLAGVLFRTDITGSYHTDLHSCKYQCEINGGKTRYFFIEERYFISSNPAGKKLGNIRKIHHYNNTEEVRLLLRDVETNKSSGTDNARQSPKKIIQTMQIELKKIKYVQQLSEDSNAFNADLYINGKKVGEAYNQGVGGPTRYHSVNDEGKQLIKQAEQFCKTLPPAEYIMDNKSYTIPMDLEHIIDNLLESHLKEKAIARFFARLEKDMKKGIVFGNIEKYTVLRYKYPIADMIMLPAGLQALQNDIKEKVLPKLKEGEGILNTNLPIFIIKTLGIDHVMYKLERKPKMAKEKRIIDKPIPSPKPRK